MKILLWDLETSPNLAYTWGLFDQNISLAQLKESSEVICFGAKWLGDKNVKVYSTHKHGKQGMLDAAWELLDEADALVSWNGQSFDTKVMAKEFLLAGMPPPSPAKEIDLMRAAKKRFRLVSNKLEYVSKALGLKGKVQHEGFPLWVACMQEDPKAWARMIRYCRQDVALLEDLYYKLLPWIPSLPSVALYDDLAGDLCPACGSTDLVKEGWAYTALSKFQRFHCKACGKWSRSGRRESGVDIRGVTAS